MHLKFTPAAISTIFTHKNKNWNKNNIFLDILATDIVQDKIKTQVVVL